MLTPKRKEYLAQKDKIVDDLRNIYGDTDEKSQKKVLRGDTHMTSTWMGGGGGGLRQKWDIIGRNGVEG